MKELKVMSKKQSNNQVTKEDLRQMKAYLNFLQVAERAEVNGKTDKYRHLADTKQMDCTIYSKEDYELFCVFVRNKGIMQEIFTEEQWEKLEAGIKLYEMNGNQVVKVKDESFDIIDSLASEEAIADIAKKIGKR